MSACQKVATPATAMPPSWSPICCGHSMYALVRRMLVLCDGKVIFSSIWNCGVCGRLVL